MNIKKIFCLVLGWLSTVAIATSFAVNAVIAQQLVPPPPVVGVADPSLARLEIKLDTIDRKLSAHTRILKAIYSKLFPLKLEQGVQDAPNLDE